MASSIKILSPISKTLNTHIHVEKKEGAILFWVTG